MTRITLHIADRPIETWSMVYSIIPRVGDRVLHPHSAEIILKVDAVLLHRFERNEPVTGHDADVYCSITEA